MLFKRRDQMPLTKKLGNLLWPKMGFRRLWYYYKHRSIRLPASEYSIACGLAIGIAISWTPLFGTHLLQCVALAWIFRANIVAAIIGSAFGNFWTFPVIFFISFQVGKLMFNLAGYGDMVLQHHGAITLALLEQEKMKIFLPTVIGGFTVGIVTFPLFYYPFYYMVKGARAARRLRIQKTIHDEAAQITGQVQ